MRTLKLLPILNLLLSFGAHASDEFFPGSADMTVGQALKIKQEMYSTGSVSDKLDYIALKVRTEHNQYQSYYRLFQDIARDKENFDKKEIWKILILIEELDSDKDLSSVKSGLKDSLLHRSIDASLNASLKRFSLVLGKPNAFKDLKAQWESGWLVTPRKEKRKNDFYVSPLSDDEFYYPQESTQTGSKKRSRVLSGSPEGIAKK